MRLRLKDDGDIPTKIHHTGRYFDGHFFISYYSKKMKIATEKEITNYVDEEMKVYFKTLDLLRNSIWSLKFNIIYKDGYFDIDINSIR